MAPSAPKVPPARVVRIVESVRARLQTLNQKMVPAPISLLEMITASFMTQAIYATAKLGIADVLSEGPSTANEIASKVGADPDAMHRLLRLLVSRSIFAEQSDGRYVLTPMGDALRSNAPTSMRGFALMVGCPEHWEHWSMLTNSVRTGEVSVPLLRGMGMLDYLETNAEFAGVFNDAMTSVSDMSIPPILAAYDFSPFRTIVDVGGGHGRLLSAILQQAPQARGILFDLASVTAGAPQLLQDQGVADRVAIESGSLFDTVPGGADAYVLKHIVHGLEESKALEILTTVRSRIDPDGKLLLVEFVLPEGNSPHLGKLIDMEMLLNAGGKERTAAEYAELLGRAGFRQTRVVQTASPVSVIEAEPV